MSIRQAVWILPNTRGVTITVLLVINHKYFLLQHKFLVKIITHTINLLNFIVWKHSSNYLNVIIHHYTFSTLLLHYRFSANYTYSYIEFTLHS